MKPFPIPVVPADLPLGPGAHNEEEHLDYLPMPRDMDTYRAPSLPEPEDLADYPVVRELMGRVLSALQATSQGAAGCSIPVDDLTERERQLIDQLLGEGEVSALVRELTPGVELRAQESIFAGIWRVRLWQGERLCSDQIEIGPLPAALLVMAQEDGQARYQPWVGALPPNVQNAPMLVEEVLDQVQRWQPQQPAHVINLSLLPVTPEDIGYLDHQIGTGRVLMLSRGYGNCRISSTRLPHCWRVIYYNSMEKVILNTVEVVGVPEVALAAPEDMADSHTRLLDILQYLELA